MKLMNAIFVAALLGLASVNYGADRSGSSLGSAHEFNLRNGSFTSYAGTWYTGLYDANGCGWGSDQTRAADIPTTITLAANEWVERIIVRYNSEHSHVVRIAYITNLGNRVDVGGSEKNLSQPETLEVNNGHIVFYTSTDGQGGYPDIVGILCN
jgi:hypothetical protein